MPSLVSIVLASVLVADLLWWWRADRSARTLRHAFWWRLFIGLFMSGQIALVLWFFGGRILGASSLDRPPELLSAAAYLWHLLLLPAGWALVAITGMLLWTWGWGRRLTGWTAPVRPAAAANAGPALLPRATSVPVVRTEGTANRREFLGMLTTVTPVLLTGAGVAYSRTQLREFRIRPMSVALPTLPPELDGLRIALVADLHVGTFTSGETVKRVVEETSRLDADLVLLPGDLINNDYTIKGFYQKDKATFIEIEGLPEDLSREKFQDLGGAARAGLIHLYVFKMTDKVAQAGGAPAFSRSMRSLSKPALAKSKPQTPFELQALVVQNANVKGGRGLMAWGAGEGKEDLQEKTLGTAVLTDTMVVRYFKLP